LTSAEGRLPANGDTTSDCGLTSVNVKLALASLKAVAESCQVPVFLSR